ncbi:hypothetical protein GVv1_20240 [Enterobacter pseudoroggenkampii]
MVPDEALAVMRMAVDTQHPVSQRLKVSNDLCPAMAVIPVLGLVGGLRGDADVRFAIFRSASSFRRGGHSRGSTPRM